MVHAHAGKRVALMRIFRVVRVIAYRIWLGLLAARLALLAALICLLVFDLLIEPAHAQQAALQRDVILHDLTRDEIASLRSACAMGQAPRFPADARAAGINSPDVSAWCVTILTRAGRDGTLGYVRDPQSPPATPAIAFDSGFVGGYLKHETLPAGTPSMATLLPVANRCLAENEPNTRLCSSVGYMLGLRSARGEEVALR